MTDNKWGIGGSKKKFKGNNFRGNQFHNKTTSGSGNPSAFYISNEKLRDFNTANEATKFTMSLQDWVDSLHGLDYEPTMRDNAYEIVDEAVDILVSKHEDYGPLNIANAPGGPLNGLAVRLHDKVSRLGNLTKTGNEPNHESLRDTFIDIINYAVIGILVTENNWE
jgi:hypothetical protein